MNEVTIPLIGPLPLITAQSALVEFALVNLALFVILALWCIFKSTWQKWK